MLKVRRHRRAGTDGLIGTALAARRVGCAVMWQAYPKKHPYLSFCTTDRKSSIAATTGTGS